jgi:hypothetical protein
LLDNEQDPPQRWIVLGDRSIVLRIKWMVLTNRWRVLEIGSKKWVFGCGGGWGGTDILSVRWGKWCINGRNEGFEGSILGNRG